VLILDDTITAIATPLGAGGLGVVRLSGPQAIEVASRLFQGPPSLHQSPSHTLHHGVLKEGTELLDDVVVGLFRAPRSYTGEDVVEFSCHGGAQVLRRVLESCLRAGARMADPGEFTRRAFVNGKMDLTQAEAVGDLIAARSDAQRRLALDALHGKITRPIQPLRDKLLHLLAHLEAHLDFVEDEIPDLSRAGLRDELRFTREALETLVGTPGRHRLWREGVRVAIVGRPNAGKSSLFNAFLQENRAIVAAVPGTTRDTLEESVVWDGVPLTLVDTAGLRETDDRVEKEGADRARQALAGANLIFFVVDAENGPRSEDREVAKTVGDRPTILVLNKIDRVTGPPLASLESRWRRGLPWEEAPVSLVSARTSIGLRELGRAALRLAGAGEEPHEPGIVLNARQGERLREAIDALSRALTGVDAGVPEEALAIELRLTLGALNNLTGQGAPEEVLDAIFSRFCVGK
jgi:tRNA modification GTPase